MFAVELNSLKRRYAVFSQKQLSLKLPKKLIKALACYLSKDTHAKHLLQSCTVSQFAYCVLMHLWFTSDIR